MNTFAVKGCICHSIRPERLETYADGFLVVENGKIAGIFPTLPASYRGIPVEDRTGMLVIPGLTDLHLHAPQHPFRGSGMDLELMDWLNTYTFPEEAKYADPEYARLRYARFARELKYGFTTRACIFATIHPESTELLMEQMEGTGLVTYVGKVNMDRNAPDPLRESSAAAALEATEQWLLRVKDRFRRTKPILTPRFFPACSEELLRGLGALQKQYGLPVQSHLSENLQEIRMVRELCPEASCYGDAYARFGLLGENGPCVMAHCVHSCPEEQALLKQNGVFIAHSPESNANLCSGAAPISRYLKDGLQVGLATDVAGGSDTCMLRAIRLAIQVSKLRWRLADDSAAPLSFAQGFYLATAGGGKFFGKAGAFLPGYAADILVLDDSRFLRDRATPPAIRLEQAVYLANAGDLAEKIVAGRKVFSRRKRASVL